MGDRLDPEHEDKKQKLQSLGIGLMVVGGLFSAVGLISFFSAFGSGGTPSAFWAAFVGFPMLGIGTKLAGFGFLGEISRYTSGEVTPVIKDAVDHVRGGSAGIVGVRCTQCNSVNDGDAKFCDGCGKALGQECESCGTSNDADSKFCGSCGRQLG